MKRTSSFLSIATLLTTLFFISGCGIFVPSDDYQGRNGNRTSTSQRNERTNEATHTGTTGSTTSSRKGDGTDNLRRQIVDDAASLIGTKYKYGGVNPRSGMDCSGLMNYVFQNVGIMLRRSSREQVKDGVNIRKKDVVPGDLVFFSKAGRVFHVALVAEYDGNNMYVIHSTSSKGIIRQEILHNSYWSPKISSFRNVISR